LFVLLFVVVVQLLLLRVLPEAAAFQYIVAPIVPK
jgi:hypothetical protein